MTDAARQRTNMVESQILTSDVTDRRILQAMGSLPRERFVPAAWADLAYMDEAVPLSAAGRMLMAPRVFAKLLQLAEIGDGNRVLDVGCGSGYSTAVLAKIAKSVVGLESDTRLAEEARLNAAALGLASMRRRWGLPMPPSSRARCRAVPPATDPTTRLCSRVRSPLSPRCCSMS